MKHVEYKPPKRLLFDKPKVTVRSYDEFVEYVEDQTEDGHVIAIDKNKQLPPYFVTLDEGDRDEGYDVCICDRMLIGFDMELILRFPDASRLSVLFEDFHIFAVSNDEIRQHFLPLQS